MRILSYNFKIYLFVVLVCTAIFTASTDTVYGECTGTYKCYKPNPIDPNDCSSVQETLNCQGDTYPVCEAQDCECGTIHAVSCDWEGGPPTNPPQQPTNTPRPPTSPPNQPTNTPAPQPTSEPEPTQEIPQSCPGEGEYNQCSSPPGGQTCGGGGCGPDERRTAVCTSNNPLCTGQTDECEYDCDCDDSCGPGPTSPPSQPTNTPTPTLTPTPAVLPPTLTATCNPSNSEVTLNFSTSGATQYAVRIDRDPTSFNINCSPANAGDTCVNSHTTTAYTAPIPGNNNYQAWVHGINAGGGWSDASQLVSFNCHKGIIQGRRVGALNKGGSNVVYRNTVSNVSFSIGDGLMSNHNDAYTSNQTLKIGNTYEVMITPPAPVNPATDSYDRYSSLCVNCTSHGTSPVFAGDGSNVQWAYRLYTPATPRIVTIPNIPVSGSNPPLYYNDLHWMFIPRTSITEPAISGGTGATTTIPPATAGLTGLQANQGSNYFNPLRMIADFRVFTNDLDDVGLVGVALLPNDPQLPASCIGDTGRRYIPETTLLSKVVEAKGILLLKVYHPSSTLPQDGYYMYNGVNSSWSFTETSNGPLGNTAAGVRARITEPDDLTPNTWRFNSTVEFFTNAVRGNQNWQVVSHIRTSDVAGAPSRDITNICN